MDSPASIVGPTDSDRLGRYDLGRELGSGGMGSVVEATHRGLGKRVAIKRFHPHLAARPESLARFIREGRAVARLHHPHIVGVFDLEQPAEGAPYLVMELLQGSTLAEYLARSRPLEVEEAVALVLPLVSALGAAHTAGVVHRDVKPSNVFLRNGRLADPCLVDFGVSKHAEPVAMDELTQSGTLVGSYPYFSPEHTRGARYVTAQSDLYSLATVLYECITGATPFEAESAYALMHTIATQDVRPPSLVRPDLPEGLDDVILRAMDRDPQRRYATMRAFGSALLAFADKRTWHVWSEEFVAGVPDRRPLERTADESADSPLPASPLPRPGSSIRPPRLLAPALAFALFLVATLVFLQARSATAGKTIGGEPPTFAEISSGKAQTVVTSASVEPGPRREENEPPPSPAISPPALPKPAHSSGESAGRARRPSKTNPAPEERGSNGVPIFD